MGLTQPGGELHLKVDEEGPSFSDISFYWKPKLGKFASVPRKSELRAKREVKVGSGAGRGSGADTARYFVGAV